MEAAFFDLDKTVIAKASMVAFSGPLHRAGLLPRRTLLRAAWGQLIYAQLGASPAKLAKLRDSVLRLTRGWDQVEIGRIVEEALVEVVEPIVFDEALDLIRQHRAEGRKVFIVSASPEEIVAPLARYLGVDEAIATRAELDERGRYTGRTERYCYGPEKVVAMAEVAERDGIDLAASYGYSDSATDRPMLEAVGHPVAVNPDRDLLRTARERGWDVRRFARPVPLRERVPMPRPRHAAVGGGALAVAVGVGFLARWWWERKQPSPLRAPAVRSRVADAARAVTGPARLRGGGGRALGRQAERTFLAATVARAATTMSSNSFFMLVIVVTHAASGDPGGPAGAGGRGVRAPSARRERDTTVT